MPILADWYDVLQSSADTKHLAVVLARYVTGSASAMGSRNEINLDNKYIVIDTSGMPDDLLLPGIFWATDIANDLISGAGGQLSALISDELWSLVGANSNPLAAGYIQEMVKTIRGLGGIAITSTQGMQDLFSLDNGKYGKGILDSSRIKIVICAARRTLKKDMVNSTVEVPISFSFYIIYHFHCCLLELMEVILTGAAQMKPLSVQS